MKYDMTPKIKKECTINQPINHSNNKSIHKISPMLIDMNNGKTNKRPIQPTLPERNDEKMSTGLEQIWALLCSNIYITLRTHPRMNG